MTENKKVLQMEVLDAIQPYSGDTPSVVGEILNQGSALQQVQTGFTTAVAVQKPRSLSRVVSNVLEEAKLAGASFFYRWEVKNKKTGRKSLVQGPSIDLATCIARNYGNCACPVSVQETMTHYLFEANFVDLENGFTMTRLFRQRKSQKIGGGYGDDRAEDIVFQIAQSKAQRNAICKAVPAWLIDQAIEDARQAEIDKIKPENIHISRGKVLDFFATYGVTQERIEAHIERPVDEWTAENISDLRGMATGLKEGRVSPDELFPQVLSKQETEKVEDLKTALDADTKTTVSTETGEIEKGTEIYGQGGLVSGGKTPTNKGSAGREESHVDTHPWARDNWIKLRTAGYSTFVYKNKKTFDGASDEIKSEALKKWVELYPETPFPFAIPTQIKEQPGTTAEEIANDFIKRIHVIETKIGLVAWKEVHGPAAATLPEEQRERVTDAWIIKNESFTVNEEESEKVACPQRDGDLIFVDYCNTECGTRDGCPAWE